ncbi:MAG: hypothetical protein M3N50_12675, partial [Pseudomonadota bacterium]|nr:hypothetical protein [Pseudomonadota bacterium]
MTPMQPEHNEVHGERTATAVNHAPSVQSRISSILAVGLMSVLGLGMLTWYYAHAMTRQSRARQSAQTQSNNKAQGDMPLPSLGRIDPPTPPPDLSAAPMSLGATTLTEIPLAPSPPPATNGGSPPAKTPQELTLERQLSGIVYSAAHNATPTAVASTAMLPSSAAAQEAGELGPLLRPTVTTAVRAQVLPTQR